MIRILLTGLCLLLAQQPPKLPKQGVSGKPAAAADPAVAGGTLSLPFGGTKAKGMLVVSQPNGTDGSGATLADSGKEPIILFTPQGVSSTDSAVYLYFNADAQNIPTLTFSSPRTATLKLATGTPQTISYVVTNRASQIDKLGTVVAAKDWSVIGEPLAIVVTTADSRATRLELSSSFTEKSMHIALPSGAVFLCGEERGSCEQIDIPAYSSRTVYLRYKDDAPAGVYVGQLVFRTLEYSSSIPGDLTIYVSSKRAMWWGVFWVLAGVGGAWWVKTWSSNRVARDQALLPVALYQSKLDALTNTLHSASVQLDTVFPVLATALDDWTTKMNPADLEIKYGIPGKSIGPFKTPSAVSSDFMTFLSQADAAVTLLTVFVIKGIKEVTELTIAGGIPTSTAKKTAIAIDTYYNESLKLDDARTQIAAMVKTAQEQTPPKAALTGPHAGLEQLSFSKLTIEIGKLNTVAWIIMLSVTALGTIVTLVLKPGFGQLTDYLICLTTAFGVPTVGGAAIPSQTASTSVTQATQPTSGSKPRPGGGGDGGGKTDKVVGL